MELGDQAGHRSRATAPVPAPAPGDGRRLPERIEATRLVLRCWKPGDVTALSSAIQASIEHLQPWMGWVATEPLGDDERRAIIAGWTADWETGGDAVYGIFRNGEVVGGCGLHRRRGPGVLEIGYWIHVGHVHHGYATEAASALTDAAFEIPGIARVEIHHDRDNAASKAIPERLGFGFAGEENVEPRAPAECGTHWAWSISRDAWREGGAAPS